MEGHSTQELCGPKFGKHWLDGWLPLGSVHRNGGSFNQRTNLSRRGRALRYFNFSLLPNLSHQVVRLARAKKK